MRKDKRKDTFFVPGKSNETTGFEQELADLLTKEELYTYNDVLSTFLDDIDNY